MATTIASATIGFEQQFYGHFHPTHLALLRLGIRESWVLFPINPAERDPEPRVWAPERHETIFEDLLLMSAIHVLDDDALVERAELIAPAVFDDETLDLSMGKQAPRKAIDELRGMMRKIDTHGLVVVGLFETGLLESARRMRDYPITSRVLIPSRSD
ncbi:hypothetical protein BH20ACT15_BH20ACT15_14630 [soil metagenome]